MCLICLLASHSLLLTFPSNHLLLLSSIFRTCHTCRFCCTGLSLTFGYSPFCHLLMWCCLLFPTYCCYFLVFCTGLSLTFRLSCSYYYDYVMYSCLRMYNITLLCCFLALVVCICMFIIMCFIYSFHILFVCVLVVLASHFKYLSDAASFIETHRRRVGAGSYEG